MSKAIEGAAMLGGAVLLGGAAFLLASSGVGFGALPFLLHGMEALAVGGLAMEAGAAVDALTPNRGTNIASRTPAGFRQIVRGTMRIGGTVVWRSTTGSTHRQLNYIIPIATHVIDSIESLYLDGRKVYFQGSGVGWQVRNGVGFGGNPDGNNHTGPGGQQYNFGGLVYAEARYGDQLDGDVMGSIRANDPKWSASGAVSPWLGGCAYLYVKVEQDANQFAGEPEIRITVRGKRVYDPRTGLTGYSDNWALHVADHLTDPVWGMGLEVNQEQLIAAANVCDEQVALAAGGTESRYTLHYHYDTSMPPSAALERMLAGAAGRVTEIGGESYIWPAYWQGPSASLGAANLRGPIHWQSARSLADRCNLVAGTYIAANYPYSVSGNLYDSNGFYEGTTANTFAYAYQPTNFPQYAHDLRHNYPADDYLERDTNYRGTWVSGDSAREGQVFTGADGQLYESLIDTNTETPSNTAVHWKPGAWRYLPLEINLESCISCGQAQRVAKIMLERNRREGTGTLPLDLASYGYLQPTTTLNLTFAPPGWTDKVLEVTRHTFKVDYDDGGAPRLQTQADVCETSATVYEWTTAEEQPANGGNASPASGLAAPLPPTDLQLTSSAATALQQPDGSLIPRIQVTWLTPADGLVSQIQMQHQGTGDTVWTDDASIDITSTEAFIAPCVAGAQYNVRIRSRRSSGATSPWVEIDGFTAGLVLNTANLDGYGQGSLVGLAFPDGSAGIKCQPHSEYIGSHHLAVFPSGARTIRGLDQQRLYYVFYIDPTYAGGDVTPIATLNTADFLGRLGYLLVGSIVTPYLPPSSGGGGGGGGGGGVGVRYYPSTASDLGQSSTQGPDQAYDTNLQTAAVITGDSEFVAGGSPRQLYGANGDPGSAPPPTSDETYTTNGSFLLSGFPTVSFGAATTLNVDCDVQISGGGTADVTLTYGGSSAVIASLTASQARSTLTASIPAGTDLSTVSVRIDASPDMANSGQSSKTVVIDCFETFIST